MNIKQALISVSDKTNIVDLARDLNSLSINMVSTGGTYRLIKENGIPISTVEDYTGFSEILGGRVKTLHPSIHGGILAVKDNPSHMEELKTNNIKPIDMVIVNLYPFDEVTKKKNVSNSEIIENIDIGGVTLIRASAKNFKNVVIITNPDDYFRITKEIKISGAVSLESRFNLALKAYELTFKYDNNIYNYLKINQPSFLR